MAPSSSLPWSLLLFIVLVSWCGQCSAGVDPTVGFIAVNLTEDRFKLDHPYDLPPEQRYEFRRWRAADVGVPHQAALRDLPKREVQDGGVACSSRAQGYGGVPAVTSGVSVMQVFGASGRNTTLMSHVYGGRLMHYNDEARVVDASIYDRWFRLNVVHDVGAGALNVFIDGEERLAVAGHGGYRRYFKFGVYRQTNASHYMESRLSFRPKNRDQITQPE